MSELGFDPAVGEKVAILWHTTGWPAAKIVTVARLTPTQIVVSDSTRFNRRTLRGLGSRDELRRADDPTVRRALVRERYLSVTHSVTTMLREVEGSSFLAAVEAARKGLEDLIAYLKEMQ